MRVYLGIAVKEGGKARRTYVDPHVHKILERVRVSGDGSSSVTARATIVEGHDDVSYDETAEFMPEPTHANFEEVHQVPVTPEPLVEHTEPVPPTASPIEDVLQEQEAAPTATPTTKPSTPAEIEELEKVASIAEQSAGGNPVTTSDGADDAYHSGPGKVVEEAVESLIANAELEDAAAPVTPAPTPSAVSTEESQDDSLDDFLSELGIELNETTNDDGPVVQEGETAEGIVASEEQLSEAELEEKRKAETAEKRAKIVARHVEWQKKLDDLVIEQTKRVVDAVQGVRDNAVIELGEQYGPNKKSQAKKGEEGLGKKAMIGLEKQGEKLVKGLESYLTKAVSRSDAWKEHSTQADFKASEKAKKASDEKDKWDGVSAKVDERFGTLVRNVQGEIHEWYQKKKAQEVEAVSTYGTLVKQACLSSCFQALEAAQPVKKLAEDAQSDLSMDYAWLEDVTYQDWQTYHDLMRSTCYSFHCEFAILTSHNSIHKLRAKGARDPRWHRPSAFS